MATVRIFDRSVNSTGDHNRVPIVVSNVQLCSTVQDFRKRLNEEISIPTDAVDVIYCGQYLRDGRTLDSYGMKNEATVYLLPKLMSHATQAASGGKPPPEALTAIRLATHCPSYRQIVERMLSNPEAVENLISATPGLDDDPAVLSLIQDPALVALLIQPQSRDKLFQQHPAFAELAVTVAAVVNEEAAKEGIKPVTGTYSLDQMDDEDEEAEMMSGQQALQAAAGGSSQPITASQLAAALATATSQSSQQPSTSGSSAFISQHFFQQALTQAQQAGTQAQQAGTQAQQAGTQAQQAGTQAQQAGTQAQQAGSQAVSPIVPSHSQPGAQPSHPSVTQSQLQQLHEMGITDEARARRALELCNGDIHAALELIFSDSSF